MYLNVSNPKISNTKSITLSTTRSRGVIQNQLSNIMSSKQEMMDHTLGSIENYEKENGTPKITEIPGLNYDNVFHRQLSNALHANSNIDVQNIENIQTTRRKIIVNFKDGQTKGLRIKKDPLSVISHLADDGDLYDINLET